MTNSRAPGNPSNTQRRQAVELLCAQPEFNTEDGRLALFQAAFGGVAGAEPLLERRPDLNRSPRHAAVALVDYLSNFGSLGGRHALTLLLDEARTGVGDDQQQVYLDLMAELNPLPGWRPPTESTVRHSDPPETIPRLAAPRHPVREWLTATLFARRATRRYLEILALRHRDFSFLGRAKPLRLEDIYVGLKVADHTPPGQVLDGPLQSQTGRTLEVPEALSLSRRLLILGEAGSGKTTLLKYLVLAMAHREPRLGPFARNLLPNRLATLLEWLRRILAGTNLIVPNLLVGLVALIAWAVAAFRSDTPVLTLAVGLIWAVAGVMLWIKFKPWWVPTGAALALGVLTYALTQPLWLPTAGITALGVAGLLFPYWVRAPLALLRAGVRRRTDYPLPILLTLNNLVGDGRTLEAQAAAALAADGLVHGQALLMRRLRAGACLLLLDALNEVTDPRAQESVLREINRLRYAYGDGNQIIVTSRLAGYGYRLDGYRTLEVQPFQPPQIADFVRHWFADSPTPQDRTRQVEGLLCALARTPRLQGLAASPLLLALIALLYESDWGLPERRAELYDEALDLLTERWSALKGRARTGLPSATLRCILTEVACRMHEAGLRVIERQRLTALVEGCLARCGITAATETVLAAILADTGLLRRKSRTSYDFVHLTFQEFLTAQALLEHGEEAGLLARAGDAWWREVIRLYAGLTGNAAGLLETLLTVDPLLAAGCLADARAPGSESLARAIVAALRQLLIGDPDQRQAAADALAEVSDWGARGLLEERFAAADTDPTVALAALLALAPGAESTLAACLPGGLGSLLRLLHAELPQVRPALRPRVLAVLEALGHPLCHVPAAAFWMGSDQDNYDERPRHRVRLDEYWIDRYPVTNRQFADFARETRHPGRKWQDSLAPGKEDHPVVYCSWEDARAYAAWCGKRLPTEAEWERAARGTDGRRYPWGNRWDGTRCNVNGRGTSPVGAYPEGLSPCGCHDMAGNVWEWVQDWYDAGYYARSPDTNPQGPEDGASRGVRGGSWGLNQSYARAAYRLHYPPRHRYYSIGFRLVCTFLIH